MSLRRRASALTIGLLALAACSTSGPTSDPGPAASSSPTVSPAASSSPTGSPVATPSASTPSPLPSSTAPTSSATPTSQPVPTVVEPTTTNTLPPPPRPSRPAPSTAGKLNASALPVPAGWKTIARKGGAEEGYQGNGTWVHARDPRYAAYDVITLGCADVTRDDYPDPTSALEGNYTRRADDAGVGLVLQFASAAQARAYWDVYRRQVSACRSGDGPVTTRIVASDDGLIDRRTYPDGDWTEVGRQVNSRVTLIILTDPGHRITVSESQALLQQIGPG